MENQGDVAIQSIPEDKREHWITPTAIFGGVEFSITVLITGSVLVGSFGITQIFWLLFVSMVLIQWIGNILIGYIGAKTGRSASVIARASFGLNQARFIIGSILAIIFLGWWAVQTAVAGNAIAAMLSIDYQQEWMLWAIITIVCGVLFSIPAVLGYTSMKWTDFIAVPAGLILVVAAIYLALKNTGLETILSWKPESPELTYIDGIAMIIGANVLQWIYAPDYTRYAKPKIKDNIIIPLGVILVGFPLFLVGAIMSVGVGDPDIVNVMIALGFPFWGFLILWFATWTSQIVNSYSMGLALANIFNLNSSKYRMVLTVIGTILGLILALSGFLNFFTQFLTITAIVIPPISGVILTDYFIIKQGKWEETSGWNFYATTAMIVGAIVGIFTQYIYQIGIPSVQSLLTGAIIYYLLSKIIKKD